MEEDNLALEIAQELNILGFEFKILQNPDEILNYKNEKKLIIMDVFKNIDNVILVDDINKLKSNKIYSLHDFDLGFFLKIMEKTGQLKEILIIGIPQNMDKEEVKSKVSDLMETFK